MRAITCLLASVAAALAGCGETAGPATKHDVLYGRSAWAIVGSVQKWMRTGHYHFTDSIDQSSSGSNLIGLPDNVAAMANGQITLTGEGDVDGTKQISETATASGQTIHLVESGCTGYDSTDGQAWFKGEQPRWLTLMVAPEMDDSLTALAWQDLGLTVKDGVLVHHLQATMTPLGLRGTKPSPNATPLPGTSVEPEPMDLWVRASDGTLFEEDMLVDSSLDLHALAQSGPPQFRASGGSIDQHLSVKATFSALRSKVAAPQATLKTDPVPASIYDGFGLFSVQRDDCPSTSTSA